MATLLAAVQAAAYLHLGADTRPGTAVGNAANAGTPTPNSTGADNAAWWSASTDEAASFLRLIARDRTATRAALRPAAQATRVLRWCGIIAVAARRVLASTLHARSTALAACAVAHQRAGVAPQ